MTITVDRRFVLGGLVTLPACRSSGRSLDADVLVLGAGLSGLHAARLLTDDGRDVLLLEGSERVGGRLHTLNHGEFGFTEGGGEQIGASYARLIDTAAQLGVTLSPDLPLRRETAYHYEDRTFSPEDWAKSELHPFAGTPYSGGSPNSALFSLASKNNPLKNPDDWRLGTFQDFDVAAKALLQDAGLSGKQIAAIDLGLNGNDVETYSILNLYRTLQIYAQSRDMGPSLSVDGGAQRLPEAMAASLPRRVKTKAVIRRIAVTPNHVEVETRKGTTYRAAQCLCTLPFAALSRVAVDAPLNPAQRSAIPGLPYTQIFQFHFRASKPFWEQDGMPVDMWTDTPIERVFGNRNKDGTPNGLFRAWINGRATSRWSGGTVQSLSGTFKESFAKIRPAAKGTIEVLAVEDWTRANHLAGGAYMHWAPGQISSWASTLGQSAGRLYFAGEHLSHLHTGMEGALESAENAAFTLLD